MDDSARTQIDPPRLTATLSVLADKHRVPGAQLAVHLGGETVAVEHGELEYGTGRSVTAGTAFPIGSISKAWTATLVMILVADGDLELDAPLEEYLHDLDDLGAQSLCAICSATQAVSRPARRTRPRRRCGATSASTAAARTWCCRPAPGSPTPT